FADTVTTLNFSKTNDPHGWLGIRFQDEVDGPTNDIIIHVRLLDSDTRLQSKVWGILGVNLLLVAYYYSRDPQVMIEALVDILWIGSVDLDLINVSTPIFEGYKERFLNYYLNAKGFANAALLTPDGKCAQFKDFLYKKDIATW